MQSTRLPIRNDSTTHVRFREPGHARPLRLGFPARAVWKGISTLHCARMTSHCFGIVWAGTVHSASPFLTLLLFTPEAVLLAMELPLSFHTRIVSLSKGTNAVSNPGLPRFCSFQGPGSSRTNSSPTLSEVLNERGKDGGGTRHVLLLACGRQPQ